MERLIGGGSSLLSESQWSAGMKTVATRIVAAVAVAVAVAVEVVAMCQGGLVSSGDTGTMARA